MVINMNVLLSAFLASMAAIVLENVIFTTAFGTSTLISLSKKRGQLLIFGLFITEFSVLSSVIAYLFEPLMLKSEAAARFIPSLYILSIGAVYIFTLLAIWFLSKSFFKRVKKYVHLSAFNCAVLSALFLGSQNGYALGQRVAFAAEIGIGFAFAAYILSINYDRLNSEEVPKAFRGFPIYILYIGIISMVIFAVSR